MAITLYASALSGGQAARYGDLVRVSFGKGSSLLTSADCFQCARRWAESKPSTGMIQLDRIQLCGHMDLVIPELTSSNVPTKGSANAAAKLYAMAKSLGMEVKLFDFSMVKAPPKSAPDSASASAPADADEQEAPVVVEAVPRGQMMSPEEFANSRGLSFVGRNSQIYRDYVAAWNAGQG